MADLFVMSSHEATAAGGAGARIFNTPSIVLAGVSSAETRLGSSTASSSSCRCSRVCKEALRSRFFCCSSTGRVVISGRKLGGQYSCSSLDQTRTSGRMMPVMSTIQREKVGPGQESVWDYPRPPRLEPVQANIKIVFNGETVVDTMGAYRVLETSHPPVYYIPTADIKMENITRASGSSFCEWKGNATWWTLAVGNKTAEKVAWSYENPTSTFLPIKGYLAFYAGPTDACFVGEERAQPQPGNFYGGWVTSNVVGPFKGGPGSWGW